MPRTTHTRRRIAVGIALAAVLAVLTVPSAGAGSGPLDGRSPDTRDAAALAHRLSALPDLRSPDTRDAALAAHRSDYGTPPPVVDGRSPDTRDFAALAHSPVVTVVESHGFDWGDFGIGVAAALGAVLILAASAKVLASRPGRKQRGPVATA
jgi:hypothetical protein